MNLSKGLSREFLAYFAETLNEVATEGLSDLMDFLSDDGPEEFGLAWDKDAFEKGKAQLEEKEVFCLSKVLKGAKRDGCLFKRSI